MPCFIVTYDITDGDSEDYNSVRDFFKSYGTWAHITQSTWAIVTAETAVTLRDKLAELLPKGSRIFVVESGTNSAWRNVMCKNVWLKEKL